ncbi:hypothetical protein [Raineyella sp. W15-4]|uniref:hypothetical protein n=1 Tax=Raineyella sp. W15-4 TaxID=3081651 RepID=UPI0029555F80|nr:hypothetical protein [Raineyella sp. W15-4]WOQ15850.1 hypothetical protein R0145_11515 [Raineyella sp. W15-4]
MSALLSPAAWGSRTGFAAAAQRRRAQLQVVPRLAARISQRSFWTLLIGVVVVGTTLLLMLNVTLQNQAFQLRTLAAQEQVLTNEQADLQQQLARTSSSAQLAQRAVDMGMVPDTTPGFVTVPSGTVAGDAKPATGGGPYAGLKSQATTAAQPQPSSQPSAQSSASPEAAASSAASGSPSPSTPTPQPVAPTQG